MRNSAALLAVAAILAASIPTAHAAAAACGRAHPTGVVAISDAAQLRTALAQAQPGQVLVLSDGRYTGNFDARVNATQISPITLCGTASAILEGGSAGYALHLDQADWWTVKGISVSGGQKGIVLDASSHVTLRNVRVSGTQQEAVHLRKGSSRNVLDHLVVERTGLGQPILGEGIYVGSAKSNWCRYSGCLPDRSDFNTVSNCVFGASISSENVDIKEGTTGGLLVGNSFNGAGTTAVDSWVDVKGNGWIVRNNIGAAAPRDGFQVHVAVPGWGNGNAFRANTLRVQSTGYGIWVQPGASGTVVACSNRALQAGSGRSNVRCTR
jgi:nitrous oxidase accessory protein NosD